MKYLDTILSSSNSVAPFIARLTLAIVIFPHGAQKLFGWWGGFGFNGTMQFFTENMGIPYILALVVILVESVGAVFAGFGASQSNQCLAYWRDHVRGHDHGYRLKRILYELVWQSGRGGHRISPPHHWAVAPRLCFGWRQVVA